MSLSFTKKTKPSKSIFTMKNHTYKTVDDIKGLEPIDIIQLDPEQVSRHIIDKHLDKLDEIQQKAIKRLLMIKGFEKTIKNENVKLNGRKEAVDKFIRTVLKKTDSKLEKEIAEVMLKAANENIKRDKKTHDINKQIESLEDRLDALTNKPSSNTYSEKTDHDLYDIIERFEALKKGGRKTRKHKTTKKRSFRPMKNSKKNVYLDQ